MNIVHHLMADLAPPLSVASCGRSVILLVHARHRLPREEDLAGVEVRVQIGGVHAVGTTEAGGVTAFKLQLDHGETADDLRPLEVSYKLVGDTKHRAVEWPVALATHRTITQHVDSQRVGWEYECADVQMQMPAQDAADTYGESIVRTTKRGFKDLPIVDVTLEERKGNENPKIEVITAPLMKDDLPRGKAWLERVLASLQHNRTPKQWADAVGNPACERSAVVRLRANKMTKLPAGARLVQTNVDIFLDQIDREPDFIKTMMIDKERAEHYDRARACAGKVVDAGRDATHDVRGLLTYALYTAIRNARAQGVPNSLGKDRAQPLLKAGIDDLARAGLGGPQRALLLEAVRALCQPNNAALAVMCGQGAARNQPMEAAVRGDLGEWMLVRHARFPADEADPRDPTKVGVLGAEVNAREPAIDEHHHAWCSAGGHDAALAPVAAHTCGVCHTEHAAMPHAGTAEEGRCCVGTVAPAPDRWCCPACDSTYPAAPAGPCCHADVVEIPRKWRCGVCGKVTAQAPPGGVCCEGQIKAVGAQYRCADAGCGAVHADRGTGRCPTCSRGVLQREQLKACDVPACGMAHPGSARGTCKHAPVRDPQRWRCPTCKQAYDVRPATGRCEHAAVKEPDRWACPGCHHEHTVRPAADECWHMVTADPAQLECPTCSARYPDDGFPGQCPSGKRILPRTIHGRTLVVAEIRKDKAPFNKACFHDVAGGQV